jgi:rRNA maturation endonuclease Nob1
MDFDGGGYILEMQAKKIVENATKYNGSHPCTGCGLIMDPVSAMYSKGMCPQCFAQVKAKRLKDGMA